MHQQSNWKIGTLNLDLQRIRQHLHQFTRQPTLHHLMDHGVEPQSLGVNETDIGLSTCLILVNVSLENIQ
uniref:Uncharacterized protein n=1 Tax=Bracon brevicornis TaxID=1563983 RepID=A0A6V7ISH3_9HYME